MAKKGKAKARARRQERQESRQSQMNDRALNDVQLMNQGSIDMINAQLQQAQEDYLRMMQTGQSVYGGAQDAIQGVETPDFAGLADQLSGQIGNLASFFPGADLQGFSPEEAAAGSNLGAAIGTAGLNNLTNDASRFGMSQAAAEREAIVGGRNTQDSLMQHMEDAIQGYNDQLRGITAQEPYQIKSRLDELRDQRLEQQLARSKMRGDEAFSEWLQNYMGGQLGGGGVNFRGGGGGGGGMPRPNPGPGGGSGAHNFSGQGTISHAAIDNAGMGAGPGPSLADRIRNKTGDVLATHEFSDLPGWLKSVYNAAPGNRWDMVEGRPQRAQIFRRTRPHVRSLYTAAHPGPQSMTERLGGGYTGR